MKPVVDTLAIIGFGLIGSSVARAARKTGAARRIVACDASAAARRTIKRLGLADAVIADPAMAVAGADVVMICTPMSAYARVARQIGPKMKAGAILTDSGSVKRAAIDDLAPHLRKGVHLVPAHPIAGTENSGPESGFAELFTGRWCIVTPVPNTPKAAAAKIDALWKRMGSRVTRLTPQHHDRVLAITSHVPHLIAYTIVNTASDLESTLRTEVIRYSAFRFPGLHARGGIPPRDVARHLPCQQGCGPRNAGPPVRGYRLDAEGDPPRRGRHAGAPFHQGPPDPPQRRRRQAGLIPFSDSRLRRVCGAHAE